MAGLKESERPGRPWKFSPEERLNIIIYVRYRTKSLIDALLDFPIDDLSELIYGEDKDEKVNPKAISQYSKRRDTTG